ADRQRPGDVRWVARPRRFGGRSGRTGSGGNAGGGGRCRRAERRGQPARSRLPRRRDRHAAAGQGRDGADDRLEREGSLGRKPQGPSALDKILAAMADAQKHAQKPAAPEPERHQIKIIKGGHEDTVTYEKKGPQDWSVAPGNEGAAPTTAPAGSTEKDPFR